MMNAPSAAALEALEEADNGLSHTHWRLSCMLLDSLEHKNTKAVVGRVVDSIRWKQKMLLSYEDYRRIIGFLRNKLRNNVRSEEKLAEGYTELKDFCGQGGTQLLECIPDWLETGEELPLKRKIHQLIRVIELAYPWGINIVDPTCGEDGFVPLDQEACVSVSDAVSDSLEVQPSKKPNVSYLHYPVNFEDGSATQNYMPLADTSLYTIGDDEVFKGVLMQKRINPVVLDTPDLNIGPNSFQGRLIVARTRKGIILMVKHVNSLPLPRELDDEDREYANLASLVVTSGKNPVREFYPFAKIKPQGAEPLTYARTKVKAKKLP